MLGAGIGFSPFLCAVLCAEWVRSWAGCSLCSFQLRHCMFLVLLWGMRQQLFVPVAISLPPSCPAVPRSSPPAAVRHFSCFQESQAPQPLHSRKTLPLARDLWWLLSRAFYFFFPPTNCLIRGQILITCLEKVCFDLCVCYSGFKEQRLFWNIFLVIELGHNS